MKIVAATVLALVLSACGSNRRSADDTSDGGRDEVSCTGSNTSFPTFDKTCSSVTDCAIAIHQTNCCGATLAIGINQAEQQRFDADEKTCLDQYPLCGCPAIPTITEDGQAATPGKMIVVQCQAGKCMTTVQ
ncbi:MAG TPA: hypothetical protein VFK02_31430 [Kofleriaceae bacterium]|nr:hypothetical protein [Kofleriaceae bacterium]